VGFNELTLRNKENLFMNNKSYCGSRIKHEIRLALGNCQSALKALLLFSLLHAGAFAVAQTPGSGESHQVLAPSTYDSIEARRLLSTKVVWINQDFLKSHGLDSQNPEVLEQIKLQINEAAGFLIPGPSTPASSFGSETKKVFPDAYGGTGMNGNYGSGRAASIGELRLKGFGGISLGDVQVKGIGQTTMLGEKADLNHTSGGYGAPEAIAEAIWSVVLNRETPYGVNQVIALIDTGLSEPLGHGVSQPRYLVVREDPVRPAHFMKNTNSMSPERKVEDAQRTADNVQRLEAVMARWHSKPGEASTSLYKMFLNYTEKVATQWAYLHANLIHHGAVTPSNFELSGRLLDLSTMSTLPGAMKSMGQDVMPFGDARILDVYLLRPFYYSLVRSGANLPRSYDEIQALYFRTYERQYRVEILKLTGIPESLASEMSNRASGKKLFELIERLRNAGNKERVETGYRVPNTKGTYDVQWLLRTMGKMASAPKDSMMLKLKFSDHALRAEILSAFEDYYRDLVATGSKAGLSPIDLFASVAERTEKMNYDRSELRRNFSAYAANVARALMGRWRMTNVQTWMDGFIERNTFPKFSKLAVAPVKASGPVRPSGLEKPAKSELRKGPLSLTCEGFFS
jgi:hypothetical protein